MFYFCTSSFRISFWTTQVSGASPLVLLVLVTFVPSNAAFSLLYFNCRVRWRPLRSSSIILDNGDQIKKSSSIFSSSGSASSCLSKVGTMGYRAGASCCLLSVGIDRTFVRLASGWGGSTGDCVAATIGCGFGQIGCSIRWISCGVGTIAVAFIDGHVLE